MHDIFLAESLLSISHAQSYTLRREDFTPEMPPPALAFSTFHKAAFSAIHICNAMTQLHMTYIYYFSDNRSEMMRGISPILIF